MFELVISLFRIKIELKSRLLHINQSMHRTSNEPHGEKTGFLPMRKQRRRSASQ